MVTGETDVLNAAILQHYTAKYVTETQVLAQIVKTVTVAKSVRFPNVKYAQKIIQVAIPAGNVSLGTGENSVLNPVM